ncbi:LytR/AlgR family response regulator transcription factor [Solicola sp. PLA-1-18]|uniref:LytR/AlgR family response regulator transcription factor n=1 Tax=Solicola sp. PLA-1-18 TaxID=3380532 RepID=UPI003B7FC5A1
MSEVLRVLVVDDEQPVLDELVWLLGRDDRVGEVRSATSGPAALAALQDGDVDAVFLDIAMPGMSGLDVARVLAQFRRPPRVVFVTAHDDHAVDAFEIHAVDYLLKPVSEERLAEAVRRVLAAGGEAPRVATAHETIPVELGGVTRFVPRADVAYVEAQGDYVRLHTRDGGSHLVRLPLTTLAEAWDGAGFVRIHRSLVVGLADVVELRASTGRCSVVVRHGDDAVELQVARRHARELRELLGRPAPEGARP